MRIGFQLFLFTLGINLMFGLVCMSYPGFNDITQPNGADTSVWGMGNSNVNTNDVGVSWGNNPNMGTPKNNPIAYTLSTVGAQNLNISQSSTGNGYVTSGSGIGGLFNSVFDLNNVFLIAKIANFVFTTIYGLPVLVQGMFGAYLGEMGSKIFFAGIPLVSPLEAILIILVTISYAFSILWIWTGRNAVRESL